MVGFHLWQIDFLKKFAGSQKSSRKFTANPNPWAESFFFS